MERIFHSFSGDELADPSNVPSIHTTNEIREEPTVRGYPQNHMVLIS
jgi:hypothetical protein